MASVCRRVEVIMGQRLPSPQVKAKMTKMTNLDEIWQTQEARRTRRPGRFEEKSRAPFTVVA